MSAGRQVPPSLHWWVSVQGALPSHSQGGCVTQATLMDYSESCVERYRERFLELTQNPGPDTVTICRSYQVSHSFYRCSVRFCELPPILHHMPFLLKLVRGVVCGSQPKHAYLDLPLAKGRPHLTLVSLSIRICCRVKR